MAPSGMGCFALAAALRSVTFCLVNPGQRVKVGSSHSHAAGETDDAANVRSQRAATIKWMGCPVITESGWNNPSPSACLHAVFLMCIYI